MIRQGVKKIGFDAFLYTGKDNEDALREVILPESVSDIYDGAFGLRKNLELHLLNEEVRLHGKIADEECVLRARQGCEVYCQARQRGYTIADLTESDLR